MNFNFLESKFFLQNYIEQEEDVKSAEAKIEILIGRQRPDRFSVITFSIFHQFDIEEFHFSRAFRCSMAAKVSKQFPSVIEAHDFTNKSKN